MKFKVKKKEFINHLNLSQSVVSWNLKVNIPVIRNVLIEVNKNLIVFKTIGNAVCKTISFIQKFELEEEGSILINPKNLIEIIEKSEDDDVILEKIDSNNLIISYENYETRLNLLDFEQFPNFSLNDKIFENSQKLYLDKKELNFIYKKIITNSNSESTFHQQIHDSVQIDSKSSKGKIYFSSTNLVQLSTMWKDYGGFNFNFCVQKDIFKNIDFLLKINDEVDVYYKDNIIYIKNESVVMEIKNWEDISGISKFGDVTKIIRENSLVEIKIERKKILNALEKAQLFRTGGSKFIKINIEETKMIIKSNNDEIGSSKEEIKIKIKNFKNKFEINIDSIHFLNVIKSFDGEEITIGFGGLSSDLKLDPIVIKDEGMKNYIQMIALSTA